jgi:hypothetical protein
VTFYSGSLFTEKNSSNQIVTHLNQGLMETLQTLSYPSIYQQALNSVNTLLSKATYNFVKKLFTIWVYDYVIKYKTEFVSRVLKFLKDDVKANNIYDGIKGSSEYALNK